MGISNLDGKGFDADDQQAKAERAKTSYWG